MADEVVNLSVGDGHRVRLDGHRVRLKGLGTAGYRWIAAIEGDEGVAKVAEAGVAEPANRRIGTSVDELFDIRAGTFEEAGPAVVAAARAILVGG